MDEDAPPPCFMLPLFTPPCGAGLPLVVVCVGAEDAPSNTFVLVAATLRETAATSKTLTNAMRPGCEKKGLARRANHSNKKVASNNIPASTSQAVAVGDSTGAWAVGAVAARHRIVRHVSGSDVGARFNPLASRA